jgi:hypothetical protein
VKILKISFLAFILTIAMIATAQSYTSSRGSSGTKDAVVDDGGNLKLLPPDQAAQVKRHSHDKSSLAPTKQQPKKKVKPRKKGDSTSVALPPSSGR